METRRGRPKGSKSKRAEPTSKTETLTIRLDPEGRFLLDFLARVRDQTVTRVIERAVRSFAELPENRVCPEHEYYLERNEAVGWQFYWDTHEGVRTVKLLTLGGVALTTAEQELKAFIDRHASFFYRWEWDVDEDGAVAGAFVFEEDRIYVLWERISEFHDLWKRTRATDAKAASKAMVEALNAAGVIPPEASLPKESLSPRARTAAKRIRKP